MTSHDRILRLLPLTVCGPNYNRGVREHLADVDLFTSRGELDAAEHYLLAAERTAGLITWDELEARDPFYRDRHLAAL